MEADHAPLSLNNRSRRLRYLPWIISCKRKWCHPHKMIATPRLPLILFFCQIFVALLCIFHGLPSVMQSIEIISNSQRYRSVAAEVQINLECDIYTIWKYSRMHHLIRPIMVIANSYSSALFTDLEYSFGFTCLNNTGTRIPATVHWSVLWIELHKRRNLGSGIESLGWKQWQSVGRCHSIFLPGRNRQKLRIGFES